MSVHLAKSLPSKTPLRVLPRQKFEWVRDSEKQSMWKKRTTPVESDTENGCPSCRCPSWSAVVEADRDGARQRNNKIAFLHSIVAVARLCNRKETHTRNG